MSNLSLPTLTFGNLDRILGSRDTKTIGYATGATRDGADSIVLMHHYSAIAILNRDGSLSLTDAGWASSTTVGRLERILRDNNVNRGETGYSIAIRQGMTAILDRAVSLRKPIAYLRGWVEFDSEGNFDAELSGTVTA